MSHQPPSLTADPLRPHTRRHAVARLSAAWVLALLCLSPSAQAQENGPRWNDLAPSEQRVLQPLRNQWHEIDGVRKLKWRELAERYPNLSVDQQSRIRERMLEWAQLSATERNAARTRYQAANLLTADERKAKWDAYQSLSESQKRELIGRAETRHQNTTTQAAEATRNAQAGTVAQVQRKSNIVPAQSTPQAQPVGPGTVQASVGASTRPITQAPQPPRHQQAGQPKIAATPEFVDRVTLLPHGSQAATAEPHRASQ